MLPGEVMVRDVFPAEVLLADGSLMTKVRVFITSHRLIVWRTDGAGRKGIALETKLAEPFSIPPSRSQLGNRERIEVPTLRQGIIVNRGKGCGCNAPLKALGTPVAW
jgi:hypothetical protein